MSTQNCNQRGAVKDSEIKKDAETKSVSFMKNEKVIIALIQAGAAIITALIAAKVTIYDTNIKNEHDKHMYEIENTYVQEFVNIISTEEVLGMPYINYKITSAPVLAGFDVIPYPYISYSIHGERKYLFLNNQFTQSQYVTDQNGVCIMKKENTTEELIKILHLLYKQKYPDKEITITSGCVVAVKHAIERKVEISLFELANGNLPTLTNKELLNAVLEYSETKEGINMLSFPHNTEHIIEEFF